jgi:hypothetical protein
MGGASPPGRRIGKPGNCFVLNGFNGSVFLIVLVGLAIKKI